MANGSVLKELAGNGRGQQVMAVTVVVALTGVLSSIVGYWWSEKAESKFAEAAVVTDVRRAELAAQIRNEIRNAEALIAARFERVEDRLLRVEAVDVAREAMLTQEFRTIREEFGRRVTQEDRADDARRIEERGDDLEARVRQLEQLYYSDRQPRRP